MKQSAFSLHDPVAFGSKKCKIENVYKDVETSEIRIHKEVNNSAIGFCNW